VQISCGFEHSVFRTLEGEAYSMGSNSFGQLGLGLKVRAAD
jgi:alpha-tubulin suppressor-like RCC1 family protein